METIRQTALRRFLLLGLGLIAGLAVGVYEFLKGELPPVGFGVILLLLSIAFLTGISLILRAAARHIRRRLSEASPTAHIPVVPGESISVLSVLRGK